MCQIQYRQCREQNCGWTYKEADRNKRERWKPSYQSIVIKIETVAQEEVKWWTWKDSHRHGEVGDICARRHRKGFHLHPKAATNWVRQKTTPWGAGIWTGYIIASIASCDLGLDDITSMDSTKYYFVFIDLVHKTSKCRQVTTLQTFVRTVNKTVIVCSTRSWCSYFPEESNIVKRQGKSSYSWGRRSGMCSRYRGHPCYSSRGPLNPSIVRSERRGLRTSPTKARSENVKFKDLTVDTVMRSAVPKTL